MLRKPLIPIDDDTEEAPWMVMGTPQFNAVAVFYDSLKAELQSREPRLFLAGMLPIRFSPTPGGHVEQLAPDILVAPVSDHPRASYTLEQEGVPPSFVLEVVSPESRHRDLEVKPERYERMVVREYALFAPRTPDGETILEPPLQGHRLHRASGEYAIWERDAQGRLYSDVLGLWLVVRGGELRAQRRDGSWLPTLDEAVRAQEAARDEIARLRAELERRRRS